MRVRTAMMTTAVGVVLAGTVSAGPARAADVPVYRGQGASARMPGYLCLYDHWDFNAIGSAPILRVNGGVAHLEGCNFNDRAGTPYNRTTDIVRVYPDWDFKGTPITLLPGESISLNNGNAGNDSASSVR
ncbi:peptidase inhibitor family I36 protein [Streptomyces litmocidini]|uniref:Peptidase inhibitor family I36 protein n=1 Tax=Streptomyces litmocidini TaxID=67318 RepID=A0ABW7UG85_9ACTN